MKVMKQFSEKTEFSEYRQELLAYLLQEEGIELEKTQTITPRANSHEFPLSFAQARLWFLDQLDPGNSSYNISEAVCLTGVLNVVALEKSLSEIVRRHETLRASFVTVEGQATQVIISAKKFTMKIVDLRNLLPSIREVEVKRLATEESKRPFDLTQGPLVQTTLLHVEREEYVLLLTMHHIASDGWSTGVFIREIAVLYEAFCAGKPSPLPELPIQYADFANWQQQWLQGEVLETQLSYWKQQLGNNLPVLELPTDRPRSAMQTFRGAKRTLQLPLPLTEALKRLSQQSGVTLFMLLLAAFQTLLYRYTVQTDICVGTPIANRNRTEIEGLIGFFINMLVLRTDLSGNPSFEEMLSRVREVVLGAYAHQDLPFEKLVEALQPERSLSHTPLFQVMFVLQNAPMPSLELPGLTLNQLPIEITTAKFDLQLTVEETSQGLKASWLYNTDLFDANTIARMAGHFQTLLKEIVTHPQQKLSSFPILSAAEQQLLRKWNNTAKEYPQDKCIHQLFEEQVRRSPDAIAVVNSGEQLTYRELNALANQLAHYLLSLGVVPEVLVGICVERSLWMVIGLLGILKAGGAYVPIDPTYPQERKAFMLSDSQTPVLLTQARLVESLPPHQAQVVCIDADWEKIAIKSDLNPTNCLTPDNLAYLIYTSGSTGKPKGVAIEHYSTVALLTWAKEVFAPEDIAGVLASTSICFDLSVFELFVPLSWGGLVILAQNALSLPTLLAANEVTLINTVPSAIAELVRAKGIPASVRTVNLAGEQLQNQLVQQIYQYSNVQQVFNLYGPSEDTTYSTFALVKEKDSIVTIGRPIANKQVYLLDAHLQLVPIGVKGEIYIGGDGLARGYFNRPDLTNEKFIPNPFENSKFKIQNSKLNHLYKTGDLARYLPDGNIEYIGRIDNQVKIRGFRIELGEIEAAIASHPAVRSTVVVARSDQLSNKRLMAYVVPNKELLPTSELRRFLQQKLPEYMMPSAFVMLDALPLTPNGKIDRHALPDPDTVSSQLANTYIAPQTPVEQVLANIWTEVLRLPQVGIHDNFFELGGDSILSIQIVAKAHQAGIQITPKKLFEHQTIAELAAVVGTTQAVEIQQGLVTGSLPMTPIQHWFREQNLPQPQHWNQSVLLQVPPDIDPVKLEQVVQQLLVHHDALRLRFLTNENGWQQTNAAPDDPIPFTIFDLSALPQTQQKSAIESTATQIQASLNLSNGPLMRVALLTLGALMSSRLLIVIHHLVVDGVSWRILLEDLQTGYQQLAQGENIQLPPKTTSFKDWAEQLTEYVHSSVVEKELAYWLTASPSQMLSIPTDFTEGANTEASARTVSRTLSIDETRTLLQEVPKAYNTQINDILLTALLQTYCHWSGSKSMLLSLEGHGREDLFEDINLSRTVGWFTTIFPVLLELPTADDAGNTLKLVKEQLRAIPNKGFGYGLLRYLSKDEEMTFSLAGLSPAQISFNYLGQFDMVVPDAFGFQPATEFRGYNHSLLGNRTHLLDVSGLIVGSQLRINWTYSENVHRHTTIESLAQQFVETLQTLINHCLSPEVGGYTPSDFPDINLSQEQLDQVIADIDLDTMED